MGLEGARLPSRTPGSMGKTIIRAFPPSVRRGLGDIYRGFSFAQDLLGDLVTPAGAVAATRDRVANRTATFLEMVERGIFAYPDSAYRLLLDAAGYDLPRIRALVARDGVEATLRTLAHDGVYVSIEEFKGIREARRGNRTFRFGWDNFMNPLAEGGIWLSSGGTRSSGIPTLNPVAVARRGTEHMAVCIAAHGLECCPVVVWLPQPHATGISSVLKFASMGKTPVRWVKQLPGYGGVWDRHARYLGIMAGALWRGITLPPQTHVPVGQEATILPWLARQGEQRGCVVLTNPSSALRLALAARATKRDLVNVTFLVGAEPVTPAKVAAIRSVGARAYSIFAFAEFGTAAMGCPLAASADDMHISRDTVAVIQRRRPADRIGTEVDALLFTSLRPDGRRMLLNMETGDYGKVSTRRCGCLFDSVGWTEHLEDVRSFEKLTPEGGTFLGSTLIALVEEVLPAQFGGDPTDYQLVEQEDQDGLTFLTLLVHPRLGPIDDGAARDCVERTLAATNPAITRVYKQAGTLRVRRAAPMMTPAGKLVPLHHLDASHALDAPPITTA